MVSGSNDEGAQPDPTAEASLTCAFASEAIFDGGAGRGGIPALVNPPLVPVDDTAAQYMSEYVEFAEDDPGSVVARVVALNIDGQPIAVPFNILWWHEVVNLDLGGRRIAVTYCPLTGSALVFDAGAVTSGRFGVSGLIFENNLVMFDEETGSLWPQLCRSAVEGPQAGTDLEQVGAVDMLWEVWRERHPDGLIVSGETGFDREYARYPYRFYESIDALLFPLSGELDERRPMKERVLGIVNGRQGEAYPFGEFAPLTSTFVLGGRTEGEEIVILWDRDAKAAAVYYARSTDGFTATIRASFNGFVDGETGSVWDIEGQALSGSRAGESLAPMTDAFVAYWFAWSAFHPRTILWTSE